MVILGWKNGSKKGQQVRLQSLRSQFASSWRSAQRRQSGWRSIRRGIVSQSIPSRFVTAGRWRAVGLAAGALMTVLLAGCGLSTLTSGLGSSSVFGGGTAVPQEAKVNEDELLAAARGETSYTGSLGDIAASCPHVNVITRDNNLTIYDAGRAGDGLWVMHRGELTKTARECQIEGGKVTVKYGFSGRVLLGPKGRNGIVSLPVTVAVADAKRERVKAETMKIETAVSVDKPIGYFSAVRTITFDVPVGSRPGEFEIQVGFDRNAPGAG
jgi:hypothetical protein